MIGARMSRRGAIASRSAGPGIAFHSAQAGGSTQSNAYSRTLAWSHAYPLGADVLVIGIMWVRHAVQFGTATGASSEISIDGVQMTSVSKQWHNNASAIGTGTSGTGYVHVFAMMDPPAVKNFDLLVSMSGGSGTANTGVHACSLAYTGVDSFAAATPIFGGGAGTAGLSMDIASAAGQLAVCAFGHENSAAITGFDQSERYNLGFHNTGGVVGDAAGVAPDVAFNAVRASGSDYAGVGVNLLAA